MLSDFIKPVCNRCGKIASKDEETSKALWDVYKMNEPCSCVGKFLLEYLKDKEKNEK